MRHTAGADGKKQGQNRRKQGDCADLTYNIQLVLTKIGIIAYNVEEIQIELSYSTGTNRVFI